MEKINLKPGEIWRRRDGGKARIYATDGTEPFPVHGATEHEDGWRLDSWTSKGSFWLNEKSDFDLIQKYDWREELKPIWAVLKPEYRYIAMDESKTWNAFTEETKHGVAVWEAFGDHTPLYGLALPTPNCPWYETLTERPE